MCYLLWLEKTYKQYFANSRSWKKNMLHKMQHKVFTFTILTSTFQIAHRSYIFSNCWRWLGGSRSWAGDWGVKGIELGVGMVVVLGQARPSNPY